MRLARVLLVVALTAGAARTQTVLHDFPGVKENEQTGYAVDGVGDVDGDGYGDLIIGRPESGWACEWDPGPWGIVELRSGRTGEVLEDWDTSYDTPYQGMAVAGAGDVDGDGVPDVIFSAWNDCVWSPAVAVHSGANGANLYWYTAQSLNNYLMGLAVAGVGDLDGDGHADFAYSDHKPSGYRAVVRSGKTGQLLHALQSASTSEEVLSIDAAGDVNDDGAPDVVFGQRGIVEVRSGLDGAVLHSITGPVQDGFGWSVAGAGRVDQDTHDDFIVGAPYAGGGEGRAFVYSGLDGSVLFTLGAGLGGVAFGWSVDGSGDFDGDGAPDFVVGAPSTPTGLVVVFSGADGSILATLQDGTSVGSGYSVAFAGDVDGCGPDDVILGAPFTQGAGALSHAGRALVLAWEPPVDSYCTAGASANGCMASLSAVGTPCASEVGGFTVTASNVEGKKGGLFFYGANGRQAVTWGTGFQCVVPPVQRTPSLAGVGTPGLCDGSLSQDLNALWVATPSKYPGPGAVVQVQAWYRDPFNTSSKTTSLSDALELTVLP